MWRPRIPNEESREKVRGKNLKNNSYPVKEKGRDALKIFFKRRLTRNSARLFDEKE